MKAYISEKNTSKVSDREISVIGDIGVYEFRK
jgi:hypothetical protein